MDSMTKEEFRERLEWDIKRVKKKNEKRKEAEHAAFIRDSVQRAKGGK